MLALAVFMTAAVASLAQTSGETPEKGDIHKGMSLASAIEILRDRGLEVFYTTELIGPTLEVRHLPTADDDETQLLELLSPFGLSANRRQDVLFVVADRGITGSVVGTIMDALSGEPVAGAVVTRVDNGHVVTSDSSGYWVIDGLNPGAVELEIRKSGYLPPESPRLEVWGGERTRLSTTIEPAPFLNDEILVVPSRFDLLGEQRSAPLALTREAVEALPHLAGDVQRAFQILPGNTSNDLSAQFAVRGGRRDELEVTLDGQELYDGYHLKEYDNAISMVATENLRSASLRTGGIPASFGDRLGGVLDLRTREPSRSLRTEVSLSALAALVSSSGSFGDRDGGWLSTARRGSLDLTSRLFGKEHPEFWDLYTKLDLGITPRHRLRANWLRAHDALELTERDEEDFKRLSTQYDTTYLWLSLQTTLSDHVLLETRASISDIDRERQALEDEEEQRFTIDDRRQLDVAGLSQTWEHDNWSGRNLRWGWHVRRFNSETRYQNEAERGFRLISPLVTSPGPLVSFRGDLEDEHRDLWIDGRWSLADRWVISLGARVDDHEEVGERVWSPRVNAARQIGNTGVLRIGWGRFHQSQRAHELQIEDGETTLTVPQQSSHAFLGYEKQFDGRFFSALRLELYDRRVSDPRPYFANLFEPFNQFPEAEGDRVRLAVDRIEAYGLEALIKGRLGEKTTWWLGYTASSSRLEIEGRRLRGPNDQPHALSLLAARQIGGWQLALSYRYRTGWPTTAVALVPVAPFDDDDGEELDEDDRDGDDDSEDPSDDVREPIESFDLLLGELFGERLDDHHRLDLRLSRSWQTRFGEVSFFVDIQNVLDRENLAGFDHVVEDEQLVREPERWPGIFPSVGVRLVF